MENNQTVDTLATALTVLYKLEGESLTYLQIRRLLLGVCFDAALPSIPIHFNLDPNGDKLFDGPKPAGSLTRDEEKPIF